MSKPTAGRRSCKALAAWQFARLPVLVGGAGEQRTFLLAARYADELNINAAYADLPRKLDALQGHLDDLGRDRSEMRVSLLGTLVMAPTHDQARAKLEALIRSRGVDDPAVVIDDPEASRAFLPRVTWGDADEVGAQVEELLAVGLDGVVFNMIVDGHDLDAVALAGETLSRVIPPWKS